MGEGERAFELALAFYSVLFLLFEILCIGACLTSNKYRLRSQLEFGEELMAFVSGSAVRLVTAPRGKQSGSCSCIRRSTVSAKVEGSDLEKKVGVNVAAAVPAWVALTTPMVALAEES